MATQTRSTMRQLPQAGVALAEKAVGLTKEVWGTFLNSERLRESGQAQQRKASEKLESIEHEVKADVERAKASARRGGRSEFDKSGPRETAGGAVERAKGTAKRAAGAVADDNDLRAEGEAQRAKGEAKIRAGKEEAKADESRARSRVAERE